MGQVLTGYGKPNVRRLNLEVVGELNKDNSGGEKD